MCGIVAIAKGEEDDELLQKLLMALKLLEYRGYDSAGVAIIYNDEIMIWKTEGKIEKLEKVIRNVRVRARVGIAHTRWATHGIPNEINAHPHTDCNRTVAVAHNGIITNYLQLKRWLEERGHKFLSDTDTEVIAHLFEEHLKTNNPIEAFRKTVKELRGSFAIVMITTRDSDKVFFAKRESPLIVGLGNDAIYLSSDIPSLLPFTSKVFSLEDGEFGWTDGKKITVIRNDKEVEWRKRIYEVRWSLKQASKAGYPHFMLKEIHEQPIVVKETYYSILANEKIREVELKGNVAVVAAGTSFYAALLFKYAIARLAGLGVDVIVSSEYPFFVNISYDIVIAVSQSGETYDTLKAVREAKKRGARIIGITNVVGSSLDRESDLTIYTNAGPEIGVAATKTFLTQVMVLEALAFLQGNDRVEKLEAASSIVSRSIMQSEGIVKEIARGLKTTKSIYVLGSGITYPLALEGALKIKEVSYIHAEALPAGEAKHGPIALVENGFPIIAIMGENNERMESNIEEMKSRGGQVYKVDESGQIPSPDVEWYLLPFSRIPPLQLLAYYLAVFKGYDPDKPRNLAKTVTVA